MPTALLVIAIAILWRDKIKAFIDEATAKATAKANKLVEYVTGRLKEVVKNDDESKKHKFLDKLFKTPMAAKTKILVAACQVRFDSNDESLLLFTHQLTHLYLQ